MSPTWSGSFGEVAPGVTKGMPGLLEDRPEREHRVGIGEAERDRHLVLVDELARDAGDHRRVGLGVVDDELDLLAVDAAGVVDLLHLQLGAVERGRVERGQRAGEVERARRS